MGFRDQLGYVLGQHDMQELELLVVVFVRVINLYEMISSLEDHQPHAANLQQLPRFSFVCFKEIVCDVFNVTKYNVSLPETIVSAPGLYLSWLI